MNIIKRLNFLTIFILILVNSATVFAQCTKFPCQKPHRFTNREYVTGQYALDALIFANVPSNLKLNFTNTKDKSFDYTITPNLIPSSGRFSLQKPGKQFFAIPNDLFIPYNSFFVLKDNKGNGLVVTRYQNTPTIFQPSPDTITFYLFNKKNYDDSLKKDPKNIDYGTKIIFDVDQFEKFMTQTYGFATLPAKPDVIAGTKIPALGAIKLSYKLDPITFTNGELLVAYDKRDDIYYANEPTNVHDYGTEYEIHDIGEWNKNAPGTSTKENDRVSLATLYSTKIIQKLPMTEGDFYRVKDALK